jgi:hypothetical protein
VRLLAAVCVVALHWVGLAGAAHAHPLAPALLEIRETQPGRADVLFKTSAVRLRGAVVEVTLPEACRSVGTPRLDRAAGSVTERFSIDCTPKPLVGLGVGVRGLDLARTDALVRVELSDGRVLQTVLRGADAIYTIPARASQLGVLRDYARLGVEHILTGFDHLMFVFGLMLLVAGDFGRLVRTVTAFTVGHSITLVVASLGFVRFPTGPIEFLIAASVLVLAVELAGERREQGALRRWPWLMAGGFGLLHGLGFAGALAEVGLPEGEIPLALLAFNVGIELGQLAFVAAVLLAWRVWVIVSGRQSAPVWLTRAPVYALGSLAAYWCFERAAALL